ncbi:translation elongation factor-like protein [Nanoarchaeota archaeon]
MEEKVGVVKHYFDKIGVALILVDKELKVGDKIRFDGLLPFVQVVESMQSHHKEISEAKSGDEIGMKTEKPVSDGMRVVKLL